jgi:hypothetical protein
LRFRRIACRLDNPAKICSSVGSGPETGAISDEGPTDVDVDVEADSAGAAVGVEIDTGPLFSFFTFGGLPNFFVGPTGVPSLDDPMVAEESNLTRFLGVCTGVGSTTSKSISSSGSSSSPISSSTRPLGMDNPSKTACRSSIPISILGLFLPAAGVEVEVEVEAVLKGTLEGVAVDLGLFVPVTVFRDPGRPDFFFFCNC